MLYFITRSEVVRSWDICDGNPHWFRGGGEGRWETDTISNGNATRGVTSGSLTEETFGRKRHGPCAALKVPDEDVFLFFLLFRL